MGMFLRCKPVVCESRTWFGEFKKSRGFPKSHKANWETVSLVSQRDKNEYRPTLKDHSNDMRKTWSTMSSDCTSNIVSRRSLHTCLKSDWIFKPWGKKKTGDRKVSQQVERPTGIRCHWNIHDAIRFILRFYMKCRKAIIPESVIIRSVTWL